MTELYDTLNRDPPPRNVIYLDDLFDPFNFSERDETND